MKRSSIDPILLSKVKTVFGRRYNRPILDGEAETIGANLVGLMEVLVKPEFSVLLEQ